MLTARVRVTASGQAGGLHGPQPIPAKVIADNLPVSIQPSSAFSNDTVLGKYTDATEFLFCQTMRDGVRLAIRKGYKVEELDGLAVKRTWEVTDDPENYESVYLAVPLRPVRVR